MSSSRAIRVHDPLSPFVGTVVENGRGRDNDRLFSPSDDRRRRRLNHIGGNLSDRNDPVQLIEKLEQVPPAVRGGAVAIGNFDGVHRGHAEILARVVSAARVAKGPAVVFTFDPHPAEILRPAALPLRLSDPFRKQQLLASQGVDVLLVCPTDRQLLELSAADFFSQIVIHTLAARAMVEGPNFCFGRGREGDTQVLGQLCEAADVKLEIVPLLELDGGWVSSSRVRELLSKGDVAAANRLLTTPYCIQGVVEQGAGRGAELGFPTANLAGMLNMVPRGGIYAGRAQAGSAVWPAAVHIGPSPTFAEQESKVEVHLVGFEGDLYGETLQVELLDRVREIREFQSSDQLVGQIQTDIEDVCQRVTLAKEPRGEG